MSLIAGFVGISLGLLAGAYGAAAVDTVDPVVTGTIVPNDVSAPDTGGSPEFKSGLALFADGKFAEAFAAAAALPSGIERHTLQWAAIYYGAGAIDYANVQAFSADAPDFVNPQTFKTRIEESLIKSGAGDAEVLRLLAGAMPNTIDGQIALASAYLRAGDEDRATEIARAIWIDNILDAKLESRVLRALGDLLDRDAHWARAMHLMMNDRAAASERLLPFLSDAQKTLVIARAAVSRKESNAKALLDSVDPAYQDNPLYIYSRAQRARQAGLYESAVDWLNKAKGELPDTQEWWYERRTLIRLILDTGDAKLAYKAADTYREGNEGRLVEARFHSGWIALSFLGDAQAAKEHFIAMAALSTLPDSVTQADYWLGRTLLKLGDIAGAKVAFHAAAQHGTIYYGLLARAELGLKGAEVRAMPEWEQTETAFEANDLVRAVRLLAANGEKVKAIPLVRLLADGLKDGPFLLQAARLAQSLGAHHVAIFIADLAEKRGTPLDPYNFPKDGLPVDAVADIDHAAIYAVARQESHFQVDAVSVTGAQGLMQLLPSTAKEVAAKVGVDYSKSRLVTDAAYNALLGSTYLASQLKYYKGSLVLAAAAYNAGAGNANKWVKRYGDPRAANVDPVIWVELIPKQETRKYVQRVLGNYLVYRARMGDTGMTIKQALRKIP